MQTKKSLLTRVQFFKAAEAFRENRAKFIQERPSDSATAAFLSQVCGFSISRKAIADLKEVTGIKWVRKSGHPRRSPRTSQQIRALVVAVRNLHLKLGEPVPASIARYYSETCGGDRPDCNAAEEVGSED